MLQKVIALLALVAAIYGLIRYVQRERDKECDYNCDNCKLSSSCKRKDYTQLNKEAKEVLQ